MSTSMLMVIEGRNQVLLSFSFLILLLGHVNSFSLGISLRDGEKLVSAFGKYSLKFFSPIYTEKRYLGIHYMDDELVWVANRNAPILDDSGWLRIGGDGNLEISHNGGNPIAISSFEASCCIVVILLPSGNLVLRKMDSNGTIIQVMWQSFDYPTDTLLPGMKLGMNLQTGHKWFLQSWITDTSPAQGSFTLGMDRNVTNQLIIWWRGEVYLTSKLWLNEQSNSSSLWTRGNYEFNFISNEQEIYFSYSLKEQSSNLIKILPDGRLSIPELGFGENMHLKVPMCRRDDLYFQPKYGFMSGEGFKFKESENMSQADCELKCWYNCSCVAYATTDFDTSCEIWNRESKFTKAKWDGINARYIHILEHKKMKWWQWLIIVAGVPLLFLFCFLCYGTWRKYKAKEEKWWLPLTIAVGVALLVPLFCYLCYLILRKLKEKVDSTTNRKKLLHELGENALLLTAYGKGKAQEKDLSIARELKIFDFQTITDATNNFSTTNKLGEGGFGPVYKGQLLDGQEIAIKRLSGKSGQGILEFKNEAKVIAKLQHTNLVRLLGCSLHGEERILVYEYLPNKSLDLYIFDSDRKKLLNWSKRFNIIEGIAQGLLYLHKYSRLRVIHRDLKASNILLDDQMNPKISDFGMARIFKMNESVVNTNRVCGTYGYMSPEYAMNGIVSTKLDVFSFGVLLLEIISGKKNNSCYHAESPLNLVGYAWQLWKEGIGLELIDPTLDECSSNEVLRCLHVGLLCVQDQAKDRPAMLDVVSMLTNEAMLLPEPKQPAFYINVTTEEPEVPDTVPENCSINDVTISVMVAR